MENENRVLKVQPDHLVKRGLVRVSFNLPGKGLVYSYLPIEEYQRLTAQPAPRPVGRVLNAQEAQAVQARRARLRQAREREAWEEEQRRQTAQALAQETLRHEIEDPYSREEEDEPRPVRVVREREPAPVPTVKIADKLPNIRETTAGLSFRGMVERGKRKAASRF